MSKSHLITSLIIISCIYEVNSAQVGQLNLQKIYKAHGDFSRYNYFLNRFTIVENKNQTEKYSKLMRRLHLELITDLDQLIQKKKHLRRLIKNQYKQLKETKKTLLSSKLIYLAKQIKKLHVNHLMDLAKLKATYQYKLNTKLKHGFMSDTNSQFLWKKISLQISAAIEKVRVAKHLKIVIQNKQIKKSSNHFFSEIDREISNSSAKIFSEIMQDAKLFSAGFSSIVNKISRPQSMKIIPRPIDLTQAVIDEL